jgi:tetratricopeptide (TPR) repeat protein
MGILKSILSYSPLQKARAAARRRDWADAAHYYQRVVKIMPEAHRAWIQLGHAHKENGDLDRAEIAYRAAIIKAPGKMEGYRELAFFLRRVGRRAEAQLLAAAGLVVAPNAEELHRELGELGLSEPEVGPKKELGRLVVHAMRRRSTSPRSSRLLRRARAAARRRRWREAAALYQQLLERDAADGRSSIQMAHALKENGEIEAALSAYREAVDRDPLFADAHLELGFALLRFGDQDQARTALANAFKLDPSLADAKRALAALAVDEAMAEQILHTAWFDPQHLVAPEPQPIVVPRPSHDVPPAHLTPRERQIWLALARNLVPN